MKIGAPAAFLLSVMAICGAAPAADLKPVTTSLAHEYAVHAHDSRGGLSAESRNLQYRVRVVYTGEVRDVSSANARLWNAWLESRGMGRVPGSIQREVLVKEGTTTYWIPILESALEAISVDAKAGTAYDLYLMRLGSVSVEPVFLINHITVVGEVLPWTYPLAELTIGLQRSGTCPRYKLTIHGDGRVVYDEGSSCNGFASVKEWTVSQQSVIDLLEHIYRIRFFDMTDRYDTMDLVGNVEDGVVSVRSRTLVSSGDGPPAKTVTVRIQGYEKRVSGLDGNYSPKDFIELAGMVEAVAQPERRFQ